MNEKQLGEVTNRETTVDRKLDEQGPNVTYNQLIYAIEQSFQAQHLLVQILSDLTQDVKDNRCHCLGHLKKKLSRHKRSSSTSSTSSSDCGKVWKSFGRIYGRKHHRRDRTRSRERSRGHSRRRSRGHSRGHSKTKPISMN